MAKSDPQTQHQTMGAIFEDLKLASGELVSAYIRAGTNDLIEKSPPGSYLKFFLIGFSTLASFISIYEIFRHLVFWFIQWAWQDMDAGLARLLAHGLMAAFFLTSTILLVTHQRRDKSPKKLV